MDRPKVGVGVIITNKSHPGCVVLGQRKVANGNGTFALPGGHLEYGESWGECAVRETREETGQTLKNVHYVYVTNGIWGEYHYITIFMMGESEDEPQNLEPDKCYGWEWVEWNSFPSPERLFHPLVLLQEQRYDPFVQKNLLQYSGTDSGISNTMESGESQRPKVGVGVIITSSSHPNCVLIGRRKNSAGESLYGLPGGHLEFGESFLSCAARETKEETGLSLLNLQFVHVANVVLDKEKKHYIDIFVQGDLKPGSEPTNVEPEKCEGWEWHDWSCFPKAEELFKPLSIFKGTGYNPFVEMNKKGPVS